MTEDEAKGKACCGPPAVAASAYYHAGVAVDAPMQCIGSACMAWRWRMEQTNKQPSNQATWPMVEPIYRQTEDGRCGLAGSQ